MRSDLLSYKGSLKLPLTYQTGALDATMAVKTSWAS